MCLWGLWALDEAAVAAVWRDLLEPSMHHDAWAQGPFVPERLDIQATLLSSP